MATLEAFNLEPSSVNRHWSSANPASAVVENVTVQWLVTYGGHFREGARHRPDAVDLIIANPTHPARRPIRHTELLLEAMHNADTDHRWPIDDPVRPTLIKTRPTAKSHGGDRETRSRAAGQLTRALFVPYPDRVADRRIVVIDDVCTTGAQLRAVAMVLAAAGARSVTGLAVARSGSEHLQSPACPGPGAARILLGRARLHSSDQSLAAGV